MAPLAVIKTNAECIETVQPGKSIKTQLYENQKLIIQAFILMQFGIIS